MSDARRHGRPSIAAQVAALVIVIPATATAQLTGDAAATLRVENNSNVFDLNSGAARLPNTTNSDTYYAYGAQFRANYAWGLQDLYASAATTRYDYQRLSQLDNDEYRLDAGWLWRLGPTLDGKLDIARNHYKVDFYNLDQTALAVQTDQRETVMAGLTVSPEWRIEGTSITHKLDEPIVQAPNLELTETSGTVAVKYLGITKLTSGFVAGYTTGDYQGVADSMNASYHQSMAGLTASYHTARTTADGEIGYSRRNSAIAVDNTSGTTGLFTFRDQLTPKTAVNFSITRAINNYVANAGSEIDTGAAVGAEWQATPKLNVIVGYTYTNRNYPNQGNDPPGSDRIDHQQYATLQITYQPRRWFILRPYANVLTRSSNYIGGDFNATVYGVYVTVLTPNTATKFAGK